MVSLGSKQSGDPGLGTVASGAMFFGVGVVVCVVVLQKALQEDSAVWLAIGGVGLVACGFMAMVSLMAIRTVLKSSR